MDKKQQWEQFLTPEVFRDRLISASMYITAFEMLKDSIVRRIKEFYTNGIDESGYLVDPKYQNSVLSRNKSPVYASLDWLLENGAIDRRDLELFDTCKGVRNRLAHELPSIVIEGANMSLTDEFGKVLQLLKKVELWWIVNVEIPVNDDFDVDEIDNDNILPGPVLMLQIMLEVVAGNEELLKHYRQSSKEQQNP